jgi:VIT1/CCC1 family predicted Fe2+/Mn2+ transporter
MENAFIAGAVMFVAFMFGAFIPLSSFMFVPMEFALKTAVISSLAILFFAGAGKTHFTGRNWFKSGIEMVIVGAVATFVAFYVGNFIGEYISYLV